ncbi:TPA: putative holin [Serratia fonticola]
MAEPVTTTAVAGGTVTGIALVAFFAGLPANLVLGAFAGAILLYHHAYLYGRTAATLDVGDHYGGLQH